MKDSKKSLKQKLELVVNLDGCGNWNCEECPIEKECDSYTGPHRPPVGALSHLAKGKLNALKKIEIWKDMK